MTLGTEFSIRTSHPCKILIIIRTLCVNEIEKQQDEDRIMKKKQSFVSTEMFMSPKNGIKYIRLFLLFCFLHLEEVNICKRTLQGSRFYLYEREDLLNAMILIILISFVSQCIQCVQKYFYKIYLWKILFLKLSSSQRLIRTLKKKSNHTLCLQHCRHRDILDLRCSSVELQCWNFHINRCRCFQMDHNKSR